eukprot:GILJ01003739.1.p1 GENE.GILJ01003739.1~~GILJ01003739.1.p1  ORF type:complete len:271 (-),score=1.40 GILJ01003739.1:907-1677(-)
MALWFRSDEPVPWTSEQAINKHNQEFLLLTDGNFLWCQIQVPAGRDSEEKEVVLGFDDQFYHTRWLEMTSLQYSSFKTLYGKKPRKVRVHSAFPREYCSFLIEAIRKLPIGHPAFARYTRIVAAIKSHLEGNPSPFIDLESLSYDVADDCDHACNRLTDTEIELLYYLWQRRTSLVQCVAGRTPVEVFLWSRKDICDSCTVALLHTGVAGIFGTEWKHVILIATCWEGGTPDAQGLWDRHPKSRFTERKRLWYKTK